MVWSNLVILTNKYINNGRLMVFPSKAIVAEITFSNFTFSPARLGKVPGCHLASAFDPASPGGAF